MSNRLARLGSAALTLVALSTSNAQSPTSKVSSLNAEIERRVATVMPKVIGWRRDIHEHPELSGEEVRTSKLVAEQLKAMGIPKNLDWRTVPANHSPLFFVDEGALPTGVKAMAGVAVEYLRGTR